MRLLSAPFLRVVGRIRSRRTPWPAPVVKAADGQGAQTVRRHPLPRRGYFTSYRAKSIGLRAGLTAVQPLFDESECRFFLPLAGHIQRGPDAILPLQ